MPILTTLLGLTLWALILVVLVCLLFYFLPTLVAAARNHPQTGAIGILNLLLSWTFLGWVVALVWAFINVPGGPQSPLPGQRSPRGHRMKSVN